MTEKKNSMQVQGTKVMYSHINGSMFPKRSLYLIYYTFKESNKSKVNFNKEEEDYNFTYSLEKGEPFTYTIEL
jgi:hypothetical protein